MSTPPRCSLRVRWGLYVTAFVVTAGFRYLLLGDGFPNDHFVYITGGWQMHLGEWPTRDWVDPGLPLMFLASAASQALFGPTLLAEAVLVSCAFGLAAALTLAVVLESTGSVVLAVGATLLEVAVLPRTYSYPKMLVYAAAFLAFYRYVSRPSAGRLCTMAVAIAVAFLFRHDHGLFLGLGGALTTMLVPDGTSAASRVRRTAALALGVLALVSPYLLYVELHGGLWTYLQTGIEFSRREATRQWHVWPAVIGDTAPLQSALVYELYAIPVAAGATLFGLRRHPRFTVWAALVVPVAVVAVLVNYSFIRDPLAVRLPDVIVPAIVLGAWLGDRARQAERLRAVAFGATTIALLLFAVSVADVGGTVEALDRADLIEEWHRVPTLLRDRTEQLQSRWSPRQLPSRAAGRLLPFLAYVDRCTTEDHRLLIGGFLVEVPFLAQRRFAAGQEYFGGSFTGSDDRERTILRRLRGQVVPYALMPSDSAEDFARGFPVVAAYLRSRYAWLTTVQVAEDYEVRILVDRELTPTRRDVETGWPCFVPPAAPRDN